MVDVVLLGVRADDQRRDPQAVAVLVHHRRRHVIVEAAPVIPGQEDGGAVPVRSLHGGVDQPGDPGLPLAHLGGRMLAVGTAGRDPGNGRQVAILGGVEIVGDIGDVVQLTVLLDGVEVGQRIPDAGGLGPLLGGRAAHRVVRAVGLGAAFDVIPPADLALVQQVGEVGPGIIGCGRAGLAAMPEIRRIAGALERVHAGARVGATALGGPLRDHEQVLRQTPGCVGLEHPVLEDEVVGVRPVVGDLVPGVVAHHVGLVAAAGRVVGDGTALATALGLGHKPIHLAGVDVGQRIGLAVRSAAVHIMGVVVGVDTLAGEGIRRADGKDAVGIRQPVRTGIPPEIGVEGPVLLHDDDHVLDLVDAGAAGRGQDARPTG